MIDVSLSGSHLSKSKWAIAIFASLAGLYFFSIFQRVGIAVIALDIMNEFGIDTSLVGLMSSMYFFPYAIAQIPTGVMLDRIGIRRTVLYLSIIACIGTLIFSFSNSVYALGLGRALVGFGVGGYYVSSLKAIAVWFKPQRFATLAGLLTSVGNIGSLVATSPLALLSLTLGWRGAFTTVLGFMLFFTAMTWLVVRESEGEAFRSHGSISSDMRTILTSKRFLPLTLIPLFVYGFFISFQGLWGGPFLQDVYGLPKPDAANLLIFIGLGFMLLGPVAGLISDRIERRKPVLLAGVSISLAFWVAMAFSGNNLSSPMIALLFFTLGSGFAFTNLYMTVAKELFSSQLVGTSMAFLNVFAFAGAGSFQYLMGVILSTTYGGTRSFGAYQLIFFLGIALITISLVAGLVLRETFRHPAPPSNRD